MNEPVRYAHAEEAKMSETKHTPGPWEVALHNDGRDEGYIRTGARYDGAMHPPAVARVCKRGIGRFAEVQANARLIAAAPELLVALRATLPLLVQLGDHIGNGPVTGPGSLGIRCDVIEAARAAIAKAEGR